MPFETGFDPDGAMEPDEKKDFEDIYQEEMTVERFQKMERRIMVQGIMVLVLVVALSSFLALNFTTRLTKIADSGETKVSGLAKDVNDKAGAIMERLTAAETELAEKIASVSEKSQQVKTLLDQATKTIQASKVDRSEVDRLLKEERAYTDQAVHGARVKTDRFKDSVLETLKTDLGELEKSLGSKMASLEKAQGAMSRDVETLDENLAAVQAGMLGFKKELAEVQKEAAASAESLKKLENRLTDSLAAMEKEIQAARKKFQQDMEKIRQAPGSTGISPSEKKDSGDAVEPSSPSFVLPPADSPPKVLAPSTPPVKPLTPGAIVEQDLGD